MIKTLLTSVATILVDICFLKLNNGISNGIQTKFNHMTYMTNSVQYGYIVWYVWYVLYGMTYMTNTVWYGYDI